MWWWWWFARNVKKRPILSTACTFFSTISLHFLSRSLSFSLFETTNQIRANTFLLRQLVDLQNSGAAECSRSYGIEASNVTLDLDSTTAITLYSAHLINHSSTSKLYRSKNLIIQQQQKTNIYKQCNSSIQLISLPNWMWTFCANKIVHCVFLIEWS